MGQRLNVEILNKGTLMANAYYHWSAYTSSSLDIIEQILKSSKDAFEKKGIRNIFDAAIDMLESTGAKLTHDELLAYNSIHEYDVFNIRRQINPFHSHGKMAALHPGKIQKFLYHARQAACFVGNNR